MEDFIGVRGVIGPPRLAQLSGRSDAKGLLQLASYFGAIAANSTAMAWTLGQLVVRAVVPAPGVVAQFRLCHAARVLSLHPVQETLAQRLDGPARGLNKSLSQ